MENAAPPDTLVVAGDKLKQAREARGMSVQEMAGEVTLSREQVRALEDGGNLPFYTAAHKRLALKKYAAALNLPLSDLLADETGAPVTSTEPAAATDAISIAADPGTPAEIRLAAAERNARARRNLLMAAVAAAILMALYAKQRGTAETKLPPAPIEASADPEPSAIEPPFATAMVVTAQDPEPPAVTPAATPASTSAAPPAAPSAAPSAATPVPATKGAESTACTLPAAADMPAWSPPYQRKPDMRVFLVSSKAIEVCVVDASGKASLVALKPNVGKAFAGRPPYVVQADELASLEIYLQGMRARVPADAQSLRLVPTSAAPPTEAADIQPSE
jgi:cytoskeleton protein RodZ